MPPRRCLLEHNACTCLFSLAFSWVKRNGNSFLTNLWPAPHTILPRQNSCTQNPWVRSALVPSQAGGQSCQVVGKTGFHWQKGVHIRPNGWTKATLRRPEGKNREWWEGKTEWVSSHRIRKDLIQALNFTEEETKAQRKTCPWSVTMTGTTNCFPKSALLLPPPHPHPVHQWTTFPSLPCSWVVTWQ